VKHGIVQNTLIKRKIATKFMRSLRIQPLNRVDGASPLPLLAESAWRCWMLKKSRRHGQEKRIRPTDEEEGIIVDEAS
jgi:hypothetical protein